MSIEKEHSGGDALPAADKAPQRNEDADDSSTPVHVITAKERLEMTRRAPLSVATGAGPETENNGDTNASPSMTPITERLQRTRMIKNLAEIGTQKPSELRKEELKVIRFYVRRFM